MKHSFFQFSEGFTLFNLKINGHLIAFKAEIIQILDNNAPNHTKKEISDQVICFIDLFNFYLCHCKV